MDRRFLRSAGSGNDVGQIHVSSSAAARSFLLAAAFVDGSSLSSSGRIRPVLPRTRPASSIATTASLRYFPYMARGVIHASRATRMRRTRFECNASGAVREEPWRDQATSSRHVANVDAAPLEELASVVMSPAAVGSASPPLRSSDGSSGKCLRTASRPRPCWHCDTTRAKARMRASQRTSR